MYSFMKRQDYEAPDKDYANYYYFNEILNDEEINTIKSLTKLYPLKDGTAGSMVRQI